MRRSVSNKIVRDIEDAAADVKHTLTRAGSRLGADAREAASEVAQRTSGLARDTADRVGSQSKALATRAVREARARPIAAGAIVAAAAALIGFILVRGARKRD